MQLYWQYMVRERGYRKVNADLVNLNVRVEGKVISYDAVKKFGFIRIISQNFNYNKKDAFVYWNDIEPEKDCFKKLLDGQFVEFDLFRRDRGFVAKNVKILPEEATGDRNGNI